MTKCGWNRIRFDLRFDIKASSTVWNPCRSRHVVLIGTYTHTIVEWETGSIYSRGAKKLSIWPARPRYLAGWRSLLCSSHKCQGKLLAVIAWKFMGWIALLLVASSKFAVNNDIEAELVLCFGRNLTVLGKWEEVRTEKFVYRSLIWDFIPRGKKVCVLRYSLFILVFKSFPGTTPQRGVGAVL